MKCTARDLQGPALAALACCAGICIRRHVTPVVHAGIFTKPPPIEEAVATTMGLLLNCANSALYMANYNLVVPSVRSFLTHLGASAAAAGLVIGCCDLASMPSTVGAAPTAFALACPRDKPHTTQCVAYALSKHNDSIASYQVICAIASDPSL